MSYELDHPEKVQLLEADILIRVRYKLEEVLEGEVDNNFACARASRARYR
jgi:hypothetical protein